VQTAERQTVYRWGLIWAGAVLALVGFVLLGVAISRSQAWAEVASSLGLSLMGWGSLLATLNALTIIPVELGLKQPLVLGGTQYLVAGAVVWLAGWGLMAAGIRRAPATTEGPSPAAGATLYPRLAGYRDFYWSTLGAYGGGILLAEMLLILLQTALSSGVQLDETGGASGSGFQLAPPWAFAVSLLAACGEAFVSGAIGAARARRPAMPEAPLGVFYLGLPRAQGRSRGAPPRDPLQDALPGGLRLLRRPGAGEDHQGVLGPG